MTAPAAPRIPTPADLARRVRPSAAAAQQPCEQEQSRQLSPAEAALAPGKLTKQEHFRKFYRLGLTISRMHPHARLLGHDLLWRASHATGRISPSRHPSIEQLAHATGLSIGQVHVSLKVLRSRGWLQQQPIQDGPRAGQLAYTLTIPAQVLEEIRAFMRQPRPH